MVDLIYCATPARLVRESPGIVSRILNHVSEQGHAPFHPFQAFPYELFEGNPCVGRNKAMEFCYRAIDICDQFWIFGVSEGTLGETEQAIQKLKPMTLRLQFDPAWRKFYEQLGARFGYPLQYHLQTSQEIR